MRLLILGGTSFLGRHLVNDALSRGHTITLFHRGRTNPDLFPNVEKILGDRAASLHALDAGQWDAVIDTSGYHPQDVRASAEFLAPRAGRYAFISTISVYADFTTANLDEDAPVARLDDPTQAEVSNTTYGPLKTHCEDAVLDLYGARALIVRPGLIVGPYDPTDRFTYWPVRASRGGEILAPEGPDTPVQYIDVRDLAAWTLTALDRELGGIYNATGPTSLQTLGTLLAHCQRAAHTPSTLTWGSPEFLAENEVAPFVEMPLWVPPTMPGLLTINCQRAIAAGLSCHPTDETVRATLDWHATRAADTSLKAGLTAAREDALLAAWHQHNASSRPP